MSRLGLNLELAPTLKQGRHCVFDEDIKELITIKKLRREVAKLKREMKELQKTKTK